MRTVLLASLRTHTRRYVSALLAVAISVGFVVVVDALASATKNGLSSGVNGAYPHATLVVGDRTGVEARDVERVETFARDHGDRTTVVASTYTDVSVDGRSLGSEVSVSTIADDARLRRQTILSGHAPRAPTDAVVDAGAARANGVRIGDRLTIGRGSAAVTVRVVGLTRTASYLNADVSVPWSTMQQLPGAWTDAVVYSTAADASQRQEQLRRTVSAPVRTRADYVADRIQEINQGVDVISYLLLLFAAIAGFVASLVIANTFTILFAQRTRDLALLRCVGATRRQVVRSVRAESVLLAVVASAIGLVAGTILGYGAAAVVRSFAGAGRVGSVSLSPMWLVAAFVGGIAVTTAASWWPTRRVVRVSPLAALRPTEVPSVRSRSGRARSGLGLLAVSAGGAALVASVVGHQMPLLLVGGMTSFVGVLLLGPLLVPALMRLLGSLGGRLGPSVRIATANAVRNPHRSATTTASLLVGVTLASAVLTGMASARSAVEHEMDGDHPVDASLLSTRTLAASTLEGVRGTRGVDAAAVVRGTTATVTGLGRLTVLAPDAAALGITRDRARVAARDDQVLVPFDLASDAAAGLPDHVRLRTAAGSVRLAVELVPGGWGDGLVVSPRTLDRLGDGTARGTWVRAAGSADADDLGADLGALARTQGATVENGLKDRAWVDLQLDILVWSVLGMLGVGIAIALVGIANTVGLSVLERTRENALLRALGLSRRQLTRVLMVEGLLLAAVAGILGTALGALYGWLGVLAIVRTAVHGAPFVMPWASLLAVVLAAALAGPLACVLPSRRAGRIAPAEGLALD